MVVTRTPQQIYVSEFIICDIIYIYIKQPTDGCNLQYVEIRSDQIALGLSTAYVQRYIYGQDPNLKVPEIPDHDTGHGHRRRSA